MDAYTVHVANIAETTKEHIYNHFLTFGNILDIRIPLTPDGVIRGYADIDYEDEDDAQAAIENYDQSEFLGKTLSVTATKKSRGPGLISKLPIWEQDSYLQTQN